MNHRVANPRSATCIPHSAAARLSFFLCLVAFCLATNAVRAVNAVITFTNSPSVVSNTYNGLVTLQINGLTNGVTNVVVQKFLDVNTNRIIDSADLLVQQFRLSVGQVSVFTNESTMTPVTVTNFMPADSSSATNQMTIPLNFQNGDYAQTLVGQYLYRITSPSGQFLPVTNLFVVTNAYFSSLVTGAVINVSSPAQTNIPNAIVLLCLTNSGSVVVRAGTVANSLGVFSLRAPPGNYFMAAAKSNFVEDISQEGISFNAASTNNGSVGLTPATTSITGKVINSANSNGLAGISGMMVSTNDLLSFYFTDTNGNFYAPVTTNLWEAQVDLFPAAFQGYLTWQTNRMLNVSNKTVSVTNSLPPANAIFYGTVSNGSALPLPGVYLYAADSAGHQSIGLTDSHGKYVVGVAAETNQWQLFILWPGNPGLTNPAYVFGPGFIQTNLQAGEAIQQNFSVLTAPYTISGTVQDYDGNPIGGVAVFATNGLYAAANAITAGDGTYTLSVFPSTWTVGLTASSLESNGYTNIPPNQTVTLTDSDLTGVNFTIEICGEIAILTTNLADAVVGQYYETNLAATSCESITNWAPAYGITLSPLYDSTNFVYPPGTAIYSESRMVGYLETYFGFGNNNDNLYFTNCSGSTNQVSPGAAEFVNLSATINLTGPLTNTTTVLIHGAPWTAAATTQSGSTYSTTITLSEWPADGRGFYTGQSYFAAPGMMVTNTSGSGSNRVAVLVGALHSITTSGNSAIAASTIRFTNLDNSVVWIKSGANLGQYLISAYGPQSTNLPPGLSLYSDGTLAGTPTGTGTNGGNFNFSVMAEDSSSDVTVQPLSIFVFPATTLTGATSTQIGLLQSSNTFQMQLGGLTNEFNYTVLMATNLPTTNWMPIFTANNPATNSLVVPDTTATNAARFYRVQISQ